MMLSIFPFWLAIVSLVMNDCFVRGTMRRERLAAVERDQERLERERTETETVISQEKSSKTSLRQQATQLLFTSLLP